MPEMPRHAYVVPPMEFGWEHLPSVAEYLKTIVSRQHGAVPKELRSFLDFYDACLALGVAQGWQGSFRTGYEPRIVTVPGAPRSRLALVWKSGDDDRTFVASEVPMPWLAEAGAGQDAG